MKPVKIGCDEKKEAEECVSVLDDSMAIFSRFLNATTTNLLSIEMVALTSRKYTNGGPGGHQCCDCNCNEGSMEGGSAELAAMKTLPFLVLPSLVTDAGPASQPAPTVSLVDRGGGRAWEDAKRTGGGRLSGRWGWTVEWSVPRGSRPRQSPPRR